MYLLLSFICKIYLFVYKIYIKDISFIYIFSGFPFCQSSYQPHDYFRYNETNFFTLLSSPGLLKFPWNVCDLLSIEE